MFLSDFKSFENNSSSFVPSSIPYVVRDDDDEDVDIVKGVVTGHGNNFCLLYWMIVCLDTRTLA